MEIIRLSEFVDSVKFIKLETTDENLIKDISKILFIDDEIVVVDKMGGKIFVFDKNGNYTRKIANRGRGPGEYLSITSCNYDSDRQIFSIYDDNSCKLLLYYRNGEFIKESSIVTENGAAIDDVINLHTGNYLCYNSITTREVGNYSGLWEMDSDGNFVKNLFKYNTVVPFIYNPGHSNFSILTDGTIILRDAMYHDIYLYKDGDIKKYLSYNIKDDILYKYQGLVLAEEGYVFCMTSQIKSNYIINWWKDKTFSTFFSLYKEDDNIKFTDSFDDSDVNDAIWAQKMIDSNMNDALIVEISSMVILELLNNENTPQYLKNRIANLKGDKSEEEIENMNPILELLYLKK